MKVRLSSEIRRYLTVCRDLRGNQISAGLRHRRDINLTHCLISTQIGTKHESSSWLLWVLGLCPPVWRVKLGGAPGLPWPPPRGELGPPGTTSPVQLSLSPLRGRDSSRPPCVEIKISRRADLTARRTGWFPHSGQLFVVGALLRFRGEVLELLGVLACGR